MEWKNPTLKLNSLFFLFCSLYCLKVLSTPGERYQSSFVSKTKCLILESQLRRSELLGIANLLCCSHDLENLVIKLIPSEFDSVSTIALCNDNNIYILILLSIFQISSFLVCSLYHMKSEV